MEKGKREGHRSMLLILGRAAGLSGLALATLGSGPCGACVDKTDCGTIAELATLRDEGVASPPSSAGTSGSAGSATSDVVVALGWDGTSCPTVTQFRAIAALKFPGRYDYMDLSLSSNDDGRCCYHVTDSCPGGRPFLVDGEARVADVDLEHGKLTWLTDALMEHASVASFARLSLQLLALGAPAELVRDSQLASLDELRHADFFFELASREAGARIAPGPLPMVGALDNLSLAALIESNLREGCIGETLAAEQLRARAERIDDERLRADLLRIADDETRHAELAFRILRWCQECAPELTRRVVKSVLSESAPGLEGDVCRRDTWQYVLSPLLSALS